MIKLQDGEFADLLPSFLREKADVAALSYAYKMAMQKMLIFASRTRLYADIDNQPSEILDLMAIEMNASYYDMTMPLDTKREIIKDSIYLRMMAGTKSALRRLVQTIYPDGDIIEWFDFDSPKEQDIGAFDIITSEDSEQESYDKILKLIRQTKNVSSHLRKVEYSREVPERIAGMGISISQYIEQRLLASEERYLKHDSVHAVIMSQYSEMMIPVMD